MRSRRFGLVIVAAALASLPARGLRAEPASAPVALEVEPGKGRHELRISLVNVSDKAVVVYLDQRLAKVVLRGDREARAGARGLGACRLPGDAVPREPDDRRFVSLEPGESANEALDLRFHCFGPASRLEALAAARTVEVNYRARFATDRLGRASFTGALGPVEAVLEGAAAEAAPPAPAEAPVVTLRQAGPLPDVGVGDALGVTLEVRGPERGRLPVSVRPDQFMFQVTPPSGAAASCRMPPTRVRPLAEFYDRLGRRRVDFDLARVCPERTFARPGVYRIRPVFRSTLDGSDVGLAAWTGEAAGPPFLVRVRRAGRQADDPVEIIVPDIAATGGAEDAR